MVPYKKLKQTQVFKVLVKYHGLSRTQAAKMLVENTLNDFSPTTFTVIIEEDLRLDCWFTWASTPQGHDFWRDLFLNTLAKFEG